MKEYLTVYYRMVYLPGRRNAVFIGARLTGCAQAARPDGLTGISGSANPAAVVWASASGRAEVIQGDENIWERDTIHPTYFKLISGFLKIIKQTPKMPNSVGLTAVFPSGVCSWGLGWTITYKLQYSFYPHWKLSLPLKKKGLADFFMLIRCFF